MAQYWCFELAAVYDHLLYKSELKKTKTMADVSVAIKTFRDQFYGSKNIFYNGPRPSKAIPY